MTKSLMIIVYCITIFFSPVLLFSLLFLSLSLYLQDRNYTLVCSLQQSKIDWLVSTIIKLKYYSKILNFWKLLGLKSWISSCSWTTAAARRTMLTQSLAAAANRAVIDSFVHSSCQFLFYKSVLIYRKLSNKSSLTWL